MNAETHQKIDLLQTGAEGAVSAIQTSTHLHELSGQLGQVTARMSA
ncbi:hypothetical protein JQR85_06845 [Stutzerimonas urumqiensis]